MAMRLPVPVRGVAQGGLDRGAIEQGVAQREQQGAEQALQLPLFVFAEALAATEDQFAEVVAVMAQAIAHRMLGAAAELQAQVGARMAVARASSGISWRTSSKNRPRIRSASRLLCNCRVSCWRNSVGLLARGPLALPPGWGRASGGVEIDGIGLLGRSHARNLWRERRRQ